MSSIYLQIFGMPATPSRQTELTNQWEQAWAPLLQFQQLSLQWIGMAPYNEWAAQSKKIEMLEKQVQEHDQAITKLQHLISRSASGNNELTDQFQKLIDQQSRQYKQLTTSLGEYIKSSASKAIRKNSATESEE